jgi:hypothetical protein
MNNNKYNCPKCNCPSDYDRSLLKRTPPEWDSEKSEEYGTEVLVWTEYHKCPICKTQFEFQNSNC